MSDKWHLTPERTLDKWTLSWTATLIQIRGQGGAELTCPHGGGRYAPEIDDSPTPSGMRRLGLRILDCPDNRDCWVAAIWWTVEALS